MPYSAYRDKTKIQKVEAKETSIADIHCEFYCKTPDCKARMTLINAADAERAYFRRVPDSPMHSSTFCAADGYFDPTKYEEKKFDFDAIAANLMKVSNNSSGLRGNSVGIVTGGGGNKSINTIHQIYCMCRKYDVYNGYATGDILADERNFERYKDEITGNKIVQCTPYHKFKDEFAYRMNYPSFPYSGGKHIRLNFSTEELFWYYYKKFKTTNHKELIIVLGDWHLSKVSNEYIAECDVSVKRQIHFLK